jgi:hypothetical protein
MGGEVMTLSLKSFKDTNVGQNKSIEMASHIIYLVNVQIG